MSADTAQAITLALAAVNSLVLPALIGLGRYLLKVERRLLTIELAMNLHRRAEDTR